MAYRRRVASARGPCGDDRVRHCIRRVSGDLYRLLRYRTVHQNTCRPVPAARPVLHGQFGLSIGALTAYADMVRYQNGSDDLIDADVSFHQTILEATGNHLIAALGGLIHTALVESFQLGWESASLHAKRSSLAASSGVGCHSRSQSRAHAQMAALLRDSVDDVKRALRSRGGASAL